MKGLKTLLVLWGAVLGITGCALPLGEDYLIIRDGNVNITYITDYNLLSYVPIPKPGDRPVIRVDHRGDLEAAVVWKNEAGDPQSFEVFAAGTVYKAEIQLSAKPGYGFYSATPFTYPDGKINSQTGDLGDPVRTISVTYNNSDEWDITYITDYNLQNYVPVPMAGEMPVWTVDTQALTITVQWKAEDPATPGSFVAVPEDAAFIFSRHIVYRAEIDLAVKTGYRFSAVKNFVYVDGTTATPRDDGTDPGTRSFDVTYRETRAPAIINDRNLTPYVPKPIIGTTAISSFTAPQYTGTVTWKKTGTPELLTGPFQPDTAYTAELTLHPASGYTAKGLMGDIFVHTGAKTVTNAADSGVITMSFPPTGSYGSPTVVYDTILTSRLSKPVSGMTPMMSISGPQYSGAVTWIPFDRVFQESTTYKAVLILNAASGYTFNGIGGNVFSHGDAVGTVINAAGIGTVTITFLPTASSTYQVITSFGPEGDETSALWMMKELKNDTYPLTIDLPDNAVEPVVPDSVTLVGGLNSPATVIINGHHSTLKINSPGTLLTVGGGVTLTLQNITLEGCSNNHAALVVVSIGGKLVLGTNAVLTGNQSTGNAGGVWVNGGTLVLNNGGVIENMSAASPYSGGGVLLDTNGMVLMNGGTIGRGNAVSGTNSGGGLLVNTGTVNMNSGTIEYNSAAAGKSGGGVYVEQGAFNQSGGIITNNTVADETTSGGGVYLKDHSAIFTMTGPARVAENNKVFLDILGTSPYFFYGAYIVIGGPLSSPVAANLIVGGPPGNRHLVGASTQALLSANLGKFLYDGAPGHVGIASYMVDGRYYIATYTNN
ncbi:MAG: right-handed parallel beta-helix repeat-containing protein [Spirochaetaceae bacterium]|jgi:hypothetical protein|nr:right-handed parallel beta-helix repeat-containing protein [Spirochaetaceae bacterium]